MRRSAAVSLGSALLSLTLAASTPPELFQRAKTQFRLRSYAAALTTLDQLSRDSQDPGNAAYRTALGPSLAFYRGACLAALGRTEEARAILDQLTELSQQQFVSAYWPAMIHARVRGTSRSRPG